MTILRWVAGLVAGGFLLAELGAHFVLGLGHPPLFAAHPTIEYVYLPDQRVRRFGNEIVVDGHGLRSEPFPAKRSGDELRVMLIGDSVLTGANHVDQSRLAATRLREALRVAIGSDVVVGNIAAESWGPANWLAFVRERGLFDADVVGLVVSSHDAADVPTFTPLDPNVHPTQRPLLASLEALQKLWRRALPAARADPPVAPADVERALGEFRELLDLARRQTPRVLVLQHWAKAELLDQRISTHHAALAGICRAAHVRSFSLAPAFRRALDEGRDPYRDHIHPNDLGQQLIADAFAQRLAP